MKKYLIILMFLISCGDFCDDNCRFNKLKEPITVLVVDKKLGKILLRDSTKHKETFSYKTSLGLLLINNYKNGDTIKYNRNEK